jgi:hypothetical protein
MKRCIPKDAKTERKRDAYLNLTPMEMLQAARDALKANPEAYAAAQAMLRRGPKPKPEEST